MEFNDWLHTTTFLSDSSIYKYSGAVKSISKDMMEKGVINKPLMEMEHFELEVSIALILFDSDFLAKDKRGNKMYSNSLKQFKYYYSSTCETSSRVEQQIVDEIENDKSLSVTSRESIVKSRIGQGMFRIKLLEKYSKCIITGVDNNKLLIASHIKPWAVSDNNERLSVDNGLLLSPTFDKLFDIGLITFDLKSKMRVSQFLGKENEGRLNINREVQYDLKLRTCSHRKNML